MSNKFDKLKREWVDISSEKYRRYHFDAERSVEILEPQWLNIGDGGHRVLDKGGISHYTQKGWIHLEWESATKHKFVA